MRAVIQRCREAKVQVNGETAGEIGKGITVFIGFAPKDDEKTMEYMLDKILKLRIFEDEQEKMNLSVEDVSGGILIIPNFTLYGDARKGRRPGYSAGASPAEAKDMFERLIQKARQLPVSVEWGVFQAEMQVTVVNDGPITLLLDSEKLF